jgi:hypothetical protein
VSVWKWVLVEIAVALERGWSSRDVWIDDRVAFVQVVFAQVPVSGYLLKKSNSKVIDFTGQW